MPVHPLVLLHSSLPLFTAQLLLEPVAYALAVLRSHSGRDVVSKAAQSLPQRHHPQACALTTPVQQGVELRAYTLAHRGRDADQLVRELVERVAQAGAQRRPRKQGPHTFGGAVEAIGEGTPDTVRRLMRKGCALKRAVGRGKGHRAFGGAIAEMPNDTTADDRGQIDLVGATVAVLFIGEEGAWQRQPT